jgi:uncharacterized 2Fe-2S/4Fe-4S cluster protein (DUF4445 family)
MAEGILSYHVDFEPIGRRGACPADNSLLEAARQLGVDLISLCGGQGTCGRCKVQLLEGHLSPATVAEQDLLSPHELELGYRLACQARPYSDVRLYVPPESLSTPQRLQIEGRDIPVAPDALVHAYSVQLSPPTLDDLTADAQRIVRALERQYSVRCKSVDVEVLRSASSCLRSWDWQAQVSLRQGECIALRTIAAPLLGLAVDLGTTKVAGYLVDLNSGQTLAQHGLMNPQIAYGEDVVARITRALQSPEEAQRLQSLAVQAITQLATQLTTQVGASPVDIVDAVVVGNTAMHHLFLGLPVKQLAMAPYIPAVSSALDVKAREVGLQLAPGAYVHVLPNIAGYVGADHVAMILGTAIWKAQGIILALDIGTNTEICLANNGEMSSVSCASGPAFEGAHIKHGMRAAAGAIEHLRLADARVEYHTIGDAPPVGLCGSGILDALAELYRIGVLDRSGRMHDHPYVRSRDSEREFVLIGEEASPNGLAITLTQHDVRELQLAKGAMRTGIEALLLANRLSDEDIDKVVIAGAFGSYIDVSSAIIIGMLPALPEDRFHQVGNAAGIGARLALISGEQRTLAQEIARRVRYIELASLPNFPGLFSQSMYLGEYRVLQKQ